MRFQSQSVLVIQHGGGELGRIPRRQVFLHRGPSNLPVITCATKHTSNRAFDLLKAENIWSIVTELFTKAA